jgi:hypothetical protein
LHVLRDDSETVDGRAPGFFRFTDSAGDKGGCFSCLAEKALDMIGRKQLILSIYEYLIAPRSGVVYPTFMNAILPLDAGTTNVKAIVVDRQANVLARSSDPLAKLCLGTVDSWLVWNLTAGQRFVTDFSNAWRSHLC